jgi:hypothetical protein
MQTTNSLFITVKSMERLNAKYKLGFADQTNAEFMASNINGFIETLAISRGHDCNRLNVIMMFVLLLLCAKSKLNMRTGKKFNISQGVVEPHSAIIEDTSYSLSLKMHHIENQLYDFLR